MIAFAPYYLSGFEVSAGVDLSPPSPPKPPDISFSLDLGGGGGSASASSTPAVLRRELSTVARAAPLFAQRSSMLSRLAASGAAGRGGAPATPEPPTFERASYPTTTPVTHELGTETKLFIGMVVLAVGTIAIKHFAKKR